jgi:NhaP-type Na+/H+ or K+/H+ antiporter
MSIRCLKDVTVGLWLSLKVKVIDLDAKQLYEKMIDFKQYGTVLLAVGVFFYLGTIIPSETKVMTDIYIATGASVSFLAGSVSFFSISKKFRNQLIETEEGQELLMKK